MPRGKPLRRPVSQAQARLYGAAAGGQVPGFNPADAQADLRGMSVKSLPKRSKPARKK